ncbi:MAG: ORF6N domain-containing protein [Kiritimatiellae bacterium]|nr:ORF6N domain-containing protein [Kiritimatiellia bacterium]
MCDGMIVNGDQPDIRSMIYTIRGVQVMLDRDLAAAYQVTTSVFNQAVKRNANRFPEGFRFQLSKEENDVLISQIVTSKRNAGRLTFGVSKMGDSVIPGLLANLRNATSVRKEYAK